MHTAAVDALLREHYGLDGVDPRPVDSGADPAASLWRCADRRGRRFAVKWSGGGSAAGLVLPTALNAVRPGSAPAPLPARDGALWVEAGGRRLSVVEWIDGDAAHEAPLGREGWRTFGGLVAALHGLPVTADLGRWVAREEFDPTRWAGLFVRVDAAVDARAGADAGEGARTEVGRPPADRPVRELTGLWLAHRPRLREVHRRTLGLAARLRARSDLPRFVACHADPHLGNVIRTPAGSPVLIDFDDAVLAPRERDLMFVLGGGVLADALASADEQGWFLDGYGPHAVDADLLAYYRGLRVLEDASELAAEVLDPSAPAEARRTALGHVRGVFAPRGLLAQTLP